MKNYPQRNLGFFLLAALGLVVAGVVFLTQPPIYKAQTRIRLLSEEEETRIKNFKATDCGVFEGEANTIKSHDFLIKTIEEFDAPIKQSWVDRYAGRKSLIRPLDDVIAELQTRMEISCDSNTYMVHVSFQSEDPQEAASIVNTIAKYYCKWRHDQGRRMAEAGIAVLEKLLASKDQELEKVENNIAHLREESKILTPEPSETVLKAEYPVYAKAIRELGEKKDFRALLVRKLTVETNGLTTARPAGPEIIESAIPPSNPIKRTRPLGALLVVAGLVCAVWGVKYLRHFCPDKADYSP